MDVSGPAVLMRRRSSTSTTPRYMDNMVSILEGSSGIRPLPDVRMRRKAHGGNHHFRMGVDGHSQSRATLRAIPLASPHRYIGRFSPGLRDITGYSGACGCRKRQMRHVEDHLFTIAALSIPISHSHNLHHRCGVSYLARYMHAQTRLKELYVDGKVFHLNGFLKGTHP